MTPSYSVVIPVHNEGENILPLVEAVFRAMTPQGQPLEVILVDDASTDGSAAAMSLACARTPGCRVLPLAPRQGQARALLAGLHAARAPVIATLDGDLQNDPADLPRLVARLREGSLDLVCGWRRHRAGPAWRRRVSRFSNALRRRLLGDGVHDAGCQLRVMRREVVACLKPLDLMQAFVPALAVQAGFRVGEVEVADRPRIHGRSKYGAGLLRPGPAVTLARLWWRARKVSR